MMARFHARYGYLLAAAVLLAATVPSGGCTSVLATAMYVIKGNDIDAEFDGLRNKRVAVVCRPLVELQYRNSGVAHDLARQIGILLQRNVRDIEVIDHRKVAEWVDENTWDEYVEIGKALDADMVVGVDLERFSIYEGQTLYQGKANVSIKVSNCRTGVTAFEKTLTEAVYPPTRAIPTSEKQEPQFRREFVRVLADQIGRHFYPHDAYADFARDTAPLE